MSSSRSILSRGVSTRLRPPARVNLGRLRHHEEPAFIRHARLILQGAIPERGHWSNTLRETTLSPPEMHRILKDLATRQNGEAPVAARFQRNPHLVSNLVGSEHFSAQVARHGILYRFHKTPHLIKYPSTLRLNAESRKAVLDEIDRLRGIGAIEPAPHHDQDKAVLHSAPAWERSQAPLGQWPRGAPVPVLSLAERAEYDRRMEAEWSARRANGLPPRDFENRVFTVSKADGGHRLCTDCRPLNMFQTKSKFQLDGLKSISQLIQPGDFGSLVDIKDCFCEFGLHPSQRRYVRFRDPRLRRWQWRTMSFGMSEAPHLCTRILKPFMGILKGLGIRCSIYLDDLLILSHSAHSLAVSMGVALEMLQLQLGLQLKISKCDFSPSQFFTALGIEWDTTTMTCYVPKKRIRNIKSTASRILNQAGSGKTGDFREEDLQPVKTRDLARVVGQCISTSIAIRPARRRLLYIQQLLGKAVRRKGWNGEIRLTAKAVEALRWWTTREPYAANGNHIVPPERDIQGRVTSDAATHNAGWGGTLEIVGKKYTTRGFFTEEERSLYINNLELLGHRKTVETLLPLAVPRHLWHRVHLQCAMDNVAAIKYAEVAVSRSLGMSEIGASYFDWRERYNLSIGLEFLAGIRNVESDALSRWEMTHKEWRLAPTLFRRLCRLLNTSPEVDLFASRQNRQVDRFFSYHHDYEALGTNCFHANWSRLGRVYAYPPPIMIPRLLQKLRRDGVKNAIVLVPLWMTQNWWPTMLEMLTCPPLLLPNEPWITMDQWSKPTWECRWNMIAVRLSGNLQHAKACRRKCWRKGGPPTRRVIFASMTRIGASSPCGGRKTWAAADSVRGLFERDN